MPHQNDCGHRSPHSQHPPGNVSVAECIASHGAYVARANWRSLDMAWRVVSCVAHLITNCEAEAAELARAVARVDEGVVRRKLEEQAKEVEARYNALTRRRDELQAELNTHELSEQSIATALQFRDDVIVGMENPSLENKQRVLEMLGVEVTVRAKTVWVNCRVPVALGVFESRTF